MRARVSMLVLATLCLTLGACRSIEGRYVDPAALRHGADIGGAPVIVERPRWLKVTHKSQELALVSQKTTGTGAEKVISNEVLTTGIGRMTRSVVETEIVSMGEMYALDFLRPLSGSSDHALEYLDGQSHPKSLKQKVDDTTLKDVLTNLDKIKGFFGASETTPVDGLKTAAPVVVSEQVLRIELYDLYDLAKGVVRAVWVQEPGREPQCAPPCPPPPPPPCAPHCR